MYNLFDPNLYFQLDSRYYRFFLHVTFTSGIERSQTTELQIQIDAWLDEDNGLLDVLVFV